MSKRTHAFNWVLDPGKFLSEEEAKRLLETAKERAQLAVARGRSSAWIALAIIVLPTPLGPHKITGPKAKLEFPEAELILKCARR